MIKMTVVYGRLRTVMTGATLGHTATKRIPENTIECQASVKITEQQMAATWELASVEINKTYNSERQS